MFPIEALLREAHPDLTPSQRAKRGRGEAEDEEVQTSSSNRQEAMETEAKGETIPIDKLLDIVFATVPHVVHGDDSFQNQSGNPTKLILLLLNQFISSFETILQNLRKHPLLQAAREKALNIRNFPPPPPAAPIRSSKKRGRPLKEPKHFEWRKVMNERHRALQFYPMTEKIAKIFRLAWNKRTNEQRNAELRD